MEDLDDVKRLRAKLKQRVAELPESVRLDYQRRADITSAALDVLRPIWRDLEARRATREQKIGHTRQNSRIYAVAIALGLGLHWWFSKDGHAGFGVGAWVVIGGALLWVLQVRDLLRAEDAVARLEEREADYWFAAASAGASLALYESLLQAKAKVEAESEDPIEMGEAASWSEHGWLNIMLELVDRASGSSTFPSSSDYWNPHLSPTVRKYAGKT